MQTPGITPLALSPDRPPCAGFFLRIDCSRSGNAPPTVFAHATAPPARAMPWCPKVRQSSPGNSLFTRLFPMTKRVRLRLKAFYVQRFRCYYCGLPMWEFQQREFIQPAAGLPADVLPHLQCTAEHLQARKDGGRDIPHNVVAACAWCNRHRHEGRADEAPSPSKYRGEVRRAMAAGHGHPALPWVGELTA